ncbi:MAG: hypothetical protein Q9188_002480 [Gyalolechia gomerana]
MFDSIVQNPAVYRRRHAMKPDQAAFLKQNPPKLDVKASGLESRSKVHYYQGQIGEINPKISGASDGSSSTTSETLQATKPQAMESGDRSGRLAYSPFRQQRASSLERRKSDSSLSSSETMKLARSDHKRKFGALSEDDDDDTKPSATAIDIIHPSELKVDDDDFGSPTTTFREDYSLQANRPCYCCDQGEGTRIDKSNGQIVISGQISRSIAPSTSTASPSVTDATSSSRSSATTSLVPAGGDTTSPSLPSANAGSSSDNGLSGGAKAGIAIGAVAGVALVAGLLFLLYRERRKRRAMQDGGVQGGMYQGGMYQGGMPGVKYPWQIVPGAPVEQKPPQEMDANYHLRGEMDGQGRPQELPGASPRL